MNPQPGDSRETVEGTNEIGGTAISRHIWAFARLSCGAAVLAVHRLLDAVSGREPPAAALRDVLALGHTSGWWLARGVIDTAAEPS